MCLLTCIRACSCSPQALRAEAAKVWGEGDQPDDVLASERGLEIYARVMAREGLFGERLELETLSVCVGAPVYVYYYPGQHSIGAPITPSEACPAPPRNIVALSGPSPRREVSVGAAPDDQAS
jgi:hypothetical protein